MTYPVLRAVSRGASRAHDPAHRRALRPLRRVRRRSLLPCLPLRPDHGGAPGQPAGPGRYPDHERPPARPGRPVRRRGDRHAGVAGRRRPSVDGAVYLSIDLDGLDPAFAPGVSHRDPGGLSVREVIGLVQGVARLRRGSGHRGVQSPAGPRRHDRDGGREAGQGSGRADDGGRGLADAGAAPVCFIPARRRHARRAAVEIESSRSTI